MKIQIRNDSVHISGYVNAVDRFSRTINDPEGRYVEKIKPGAFQNAIDRASDIGVMLNHNRDLTSVRKGGITLKEDNIGLFFDGEIKDSEVIERAKNKELVGWSFGFFKRKFEDQKCDRSDADFERTIDEMDLIEVSIIDKRFQPCYPATSIQARADCEESIILRSEESDTEYIDETEKKDFSKEKALLEIRKRRLNIKKKKIF